jgi:AcrR family transcriptional regulator
MPTDEPSPALPPAVDLLWGRRSKGRTGPRPELSIDSIVHAAIALADAEGLEAVSMARVARALGFTPMSLYRHVTGKDELLQLMWNASAQGAEQLVLEGKGWRERLLHWALVQRHMIDRHPWITQMPMAAPPLAPNSLHFVERGLEALDDTPLTDEEKLRAIGLISSYTLSEARMAHDAAQALAAASAAGTGPPPSFEALLRELVDAPTFPRLHRIAFSDEIGPAPDGYEQSEEFRWGIERILDGIEALCRERGLA